MQCLLENNSAMFEKYHTRYVLLVQHHELFRCDAKVRWPWGSVVFAEKSGRYVFYNWQLAASLTVAWEHTMNVCPPLENSRGLRTGWGKSGRVAHIYITRVRIGKRSVPLQCFWTIEARGVPFKDKSAWNVAQISPYQESRFLWRMVLIPLFIKNGRVITTHRLRRNPVRKIKIEPKRHSCNILSKYLKNAQIEFLITSITTPALQDFNQLPFKRFL